MLKKSFFIVLFLGLGSLLQAQEKVYDFNHNCKKAYAYTINLQLDSALIFIEKEKVANVNNLLPVLLMNYQDFLKVVLLEDEKQFELYKERKKHRLVAWKTGPKNSPWFLAGEAQIKLQWAFARVLFDEYFTAAGEINSAYHLLEDNRKLFPDFIHDNMGIGVLHAMIGVFPEQYQWALELLGFYGTIEQGIQEIKDQLEQKEDAYAAEALFYYTFVRLNLQNDSARFSDILSYYNKDPYNIMAQNSPLLHFSKSVVLLKINTDTAIQYLKNAPQKPAAWPFYYSDFLLGQALLWKLDNQAPYYLKKYEQEYPGKNYKKTALQRLAWWHFSQQDTLGYLNNMASILNIRAAILDADKAAQKEAESVKEKGYLPNLHLLRSRLQSDGKYFEGALSELEMIDVQGLNKEAELEYYYRKARIYHQTNQLSLAKKNYVITLEIGAQSERYFAAKAALKLGEIYESAHHTTQAQYYFQACLDLDFTEYRKGIRSKAKAGLQRLEE
ncbi:MAG: hypothetical protein B7C24_11010 [Bacteroidetes bacterium 4572_77]|nr:MAG: hypothetical protein B7C24_11010 [Bacteroidetes bacterium 4572_77]